MNPQEAMNIIDGMSPDQNEVVADIATKLLDVSSDLALVSYAWENAKKDASYMTVEDFVGAFDIVMALVKDRIDQMRSVPGGDVLDDATDMKRQTMVAFIDKALDADFPPKAYEPPF